jgi:hypothetical protein
MAGNGSRGGSSRSSGGAVASQPPRPTSLQVSQFVKASEGARSRNNQGSMRTGPMEDRAAREVNSRIGRIATGSLRRAERTLQTAQNARMYRDMGLFAVGRRRAGFRFPATRLY